MLLFKKIKGRSYIPEFEFETPPFPPSLSLFLPLSVSLEQFLVIRFFFSRMMDGGYFSMAEEVCQLSLRYKFILLNIGCGHRKYM